jgi:hypothetical protein
MHSSIKRRDVWNKELLTTPLKNVLIQVTIATKLALPTTSAYNVIGIALILLGI